MAIFQYKAVSAEGRVTRGRIDALNLADLEMRLKRMELDLITGKSIERRSLFGTRKVSRRELIAFCFHLEQQTRAGVPIIESLVDLRDSIEYSYLREIIANLVESIEGGKTLSEALAQHYKVFNKVFTNLIRAGEATGQLPEVLNSIIESLKWEDELASHAKKIILYPAFVFASVAVAGFFLMIYLVPQLKQFVKNMGQEFPLHTRILFFVSDLFVAYWYIALIAPICIFLGSNYMLRRNPALRLRYDALKLRLPIIGNILRKIILSRFASTFALLYASGIPILEAIRTTRAVVGNRQIEEGLARIEQLIIEGQNVTAAFHATGLFPPLVIRMIRVGESTGALDNALANVSYFYNRDVREAVEKAKTMIEPILIAILGTVLGWIMLSVLGPVYDVITRIKT